MIEELPITTLIFDTKPKSKETKIPDVGIPDVVILNGKLSPSMLTVENFLKTQDPGCVSPKKVKNKA